MAALRPPCSCAVLHSVLYQNTDDKNTHTHTLTGGDGGIAGGPITNATHSYSPQQDDHLPVSLLPLVVSCRPDGS